MLWAVVLFLPNLLLAQTVHLESNALKWQDSEKFCVQRGGHLVSLHNAFQVNEYTALAKNTNCQSYLTGGTCQNGQCSWSDGSSFNFNNWSPGMPSAGQNYVSISLSTGLWSTVSGDTSLCFICETTKQMTDCLDWKKAGYNEDGLYLISVAGNTVVVFCDMTTDEGGWTLFQKRIDGSESFWNRSWTDYKLGFGTTDSNFWLGNELLHGLTTKDPLVTMKIEMWNDRTPGSQLASDYWWNNYDTFQISSESDFYRLRLSLDWQNVKGNASDGWYDITYSSGAPFSTIDKINDPQTDCVTKYQMGGWWLYNCALATLNGAYVPIDWSTGYGLFFVLNGGDVVIHPRRTTMKLRAVK